jgi:hypothetical protein
MEFDERKPALNLTSEKAITYKSTNRKVTLTFSYNSLIIRFTLTFYSILSLLSVTYQTIGFSFKYLSTISTKILKSILIQIINLEKIC